MLHFSALVKPPLHSSLWIGSSYIILRTYIHVVGSASAHSVSGRKKKVESQTKTTCHVEQYDRRCRRHRDRTVDEIYRNSCECGWVCPWQAFVVVIISYSYSFVTEIRDHRHWEFRGRNAPFSVLSSQNLSPKNPGGRSKSSRSIPNRLFCLFYSLTLANEWWLPRIYHGTVNRMQNIIRVVVIAATYSVSLVMQSCLGRS